MRKNIVLTSLLVAASFAGCRKESPEISHISESTYTIYSENYWSSLFDGYWNSMSQSYLFWKYETTDWDAIYDEYAPQFAECDSLYTNDPDRYFEYSDELTDLSDSQMYYGDTKAALLFQEVALKLLDHHYAVYLKDLNIGFCGSATVDIPSRDYYHEYNDIGLLGGLEHIIDYEKSIGRITEYKSGEYKVIESYSDNLNMISYLIDDTIPYLYFSNFGICLGADDEEDPGYELPSIRMTIKRVRCLTTLSVWCETPQI